MSAPIYDLTDLWSNPTTVFDGIKINVNNGASAPGSRLMRLQTNGVSQFQVDPSLGIIVGNPIGGAMGPGIVNALGFSIDGVPIVTKTYVDSNLAGKQPLDGDLTALSALTGISVIYYRSGVDTWSPVTIGNGMNFSGGILTATGAITGNAPPLVISAGGVLSIDYNPAQFTLKSLTQFNIADNVTLPGICSVSVGPAAADNSLKIATTGFVKQVAQPLDGDLTSLSAAAGTNTIYYRSGPDTWTPVSVGSGLSFAGGTLQATAGGGNVSSAGTPVAGQVAVWTDSTHIQGIVPSGLGLQPLDADLTAIAALTGTNTIYYRSAPDTWGPVTIGTGLTFASGTLSATGGPYQPLDGDLTALAALSGTNTMYYRSGVDAWSPVTMGANMTFSGGVLNSTGSGGGGIPEAPTDSKFYARRNTAWSDIAAAFATLASPVFTGDPQAPTPAPTDNDTSIATTAFVSTKVGNYLPLIGGTLTGNLTLTLASPAISLNKSASGQNSAIIGLKGGLQRWAVEFGNVTGETGSNVGSDFVIDRYNDAGAFIDVPLSIARNTGVVSISDGLVVSNGINVQSAGITLAGSLNSGGDILISKANPQIDIRKTASGQANSIIGRTGATARWTIFPGDATAESGSNNGSDFQLVRYNDAGTAIDSPFVMLRSSGNLFLTGQLNVPAGVLGNQTGSSAAAGVVGEVINSSLGSGSSTALVTDTPTAILTITVGAGDWELFGGVGFNSTSPTTTVNYWGASISASAGVISADVLTGMFIPMFGQSPFNFLSTPKYPIPGPLRISAASPTTIYLNAQAGFTGQVKVFGQLYAVRRR